MKDLLEVLKKSRPVLERVVEEGRMTPEEDETLAAVLDACSGVIEAQSAALTLANARIARLEEALRPFGGLADKHDEYGDDDDTPAILGKLMASDLRRARALMAAIEAATTRERERCAEIALLHTKADVGDAAATAAEGLRLGAASIYNAILKGEA